MRHAFCRGLLVVALVTLTPRAWAADPASVEFFEAKIRPVLIEHCYKCHSAEAQAQKKLKANLFLDSRDGLVRGGDSGPVVVAGKPAASHLLKTLRYDGDVKMPPRGKLPDAVVADIEAWVKAGAHDPRVTGTVRRQVGLSLEEGRSFWAYKKPISPSRPAVKNAAWPADDLDRLVLAALEARGLTPAGDADRATLARRLSYDLTGLPMPLADVDAFVRDTDPRAYEALVDRLLASPAFGERWGRHWLDVMRYAESVTLRGFVFKEAWRYRDYVIDSFNRDVPFDRFLREQLAGDLLHAGTPAERSRQLVATTFLALGNTNLEEQDKKQLRMDVVDEQLDVITRGFLAQTVTCARCHDHKFDPIPTRDYYALAGILRSTRAMEHANVSKWLEAPLPLEPEVEAALKAHEAKVAALQTRIAALKPKSAGAVVKGALPVKDVAGIVVDDGQAKKVGTWQNSTHTGTYIGDGYTHDRDESKGQKTITFDPVLPATGRYEVRLAYAPGTNRSEAVPVTVFSADGEKTLTVNMKSAPPLDGRFLSLGTYRFEKTGQSFVIVSNEGTKGHVIADAVTFLAVDEAESGGPQKPPSGETVKSLEAELVRLQSSGPQRPMAMTVFEEKVVEDARVHVRGSVHTLGEAAPRGFLRVAVTGATPTMPRAQSGRVELADWIASPDNPLTARVFANRAWHWLFGAGLVRTTDNFGTTGERPSNVELLDELALGFVADGWSVKRLVRRTVLSRTYRQSADVQPRAMAIDPENRLYGRANRRRLEAECLRDTMLAVSGRLSGERGGPTFAASLAADYGYKAASTRRSVYLPMFRNSLPEMLEVFDMADPSVVTGRRDTSTVAPQALFLLNNPFVAEQAWFAADRLLAEDGDDEARLTRVYRLTLGREPTAGERQVGTAFLRRSSDPRDGWAALVHALFASADFRFVE